MKFYRFDCRKYADIDPETEVVYARHLTVNMSTYEMDKETPCGYWIVRELSSLSGAAQWRDRKWISKTSKKKYAYPTIKEAYDSFCRRRQVYRSILMARIADIEESLDKAFHLFEVESDKQKQKEIMESFIRNA